MIILELVGYDFAAMLSLVKPGDGGWLDSILGIANLIIAGCLLLTAAVLVLTLRQRMKNEDLPTPRKYLAAAILLAMVSCGISQSGAVLATLFPTLVIVAWFKCLATAIALAGSLGTLPLLRKAWSMLGSDPAVAIVPTEMEALSEFCPITIIRVDPQGRVVFINNHWESITGYGVDEMYSESGNGFLMSVHPEDRHQVLRTLCYGEWTAAVPKTFEFRVVHKTTWAVRWVKCTANRVAKGIVGIIVDITEQKESESYQEKVTATIVENTPEAIFLLDERGCFTYANPAAEQMFSYLNDDLLGRPFSEVLSSPVHSKKPCAITSALQQNLRLKGHEDVLARRTGELLEVSLTVSPLFRNGQVSGAAVFVRDETLRKKNQYEVVRNNEILQQVNAALSRSNEDLKSFAYAASHDLQEPLRSVGAFSQMLILKFKDVADTESLEYMRYITDGVTRMSSMIRDLLEYSRIESQGRPFAEVRLSTIMKDVVSDLNTLISETGAMIVCESVLPIVKGDATQLQRVVKNLLLNAIKFARTGVVPIIQINAVEYDRWSWAVSIKDNGIGIDPEFSEKIFELFRRMDHSDHGTGIGLTVCRKIIMRHGGRIWAERNEEGGSCLWFTLPKMDLFREVGTLRIEMPKTIAAPSQT